MKHLTKALGFDPMTWLESYPKTGIPIMEACITKKQTVTIRMDFKCRILPIMCVGDPQGNRLYMLKVSYNTSLQLWPNITMTSLQITVQTSGV